MRSLTKKLLTLAVSLLLYGSCAAEPLGLRHNPFARPPSVVAVPDRDVRRQAGLAEAPVVLATLVGTRDRLANVDGRTLRPGDEIYGYTLVKVFENRAVFERQGNRTIVYVRPQPEESDE